MKGIELAEGFFNQYKDILLTEDISDFVSAGLVGRGSDCYGFDDDVSTDHDFSPDFCLFVDDSEYDRIAPILQKRYDDLPESYMGIKRQPISCGSEKRRGVFSCSEFYRGIIGRDTSPSNPSEWLRIPDHALSEATNGRLFTDNATDFTYVRNTLINGVPGDVWHKKISYALVMMAQSGQYNHERCLKHGEYGAARLALSGFAVNAASCVYYLNGKFPPYYKWIFKGMEDLRFGSKLKSMIEELLLYQNGKDAQNGIEMVSAIILGEVKRRGLSFGNEDFLEPHAYRVLESIKDPSVRGTHIMEI